MIVQAKTFDEERALYNLQDATVRDCTFAGPKDGESALKEARNVTLENCAFSLRYPLWHTVGFNLKNCTMEDTDLSFEYSQVEATVKGHIDSVKNPASGFITADSIGQVIWEDSVIESTCKVNIR